MNDDDTVTATIDEGARHLRWWGLGFGVVYILSPWFGAMSPAGLLRSPLIANMVNILIPVLIAASLPIGILCVATLALSMWRPEGRDWRDVDRVFAILLGVYVAPWLFVDAWFRLTADQTETQEIFTEATMRLLVGIGWLNLGLIILGAILFYARSSWAVIPLSIYVLLSAPYHSSISVPDHPEYLEAVAATERRAPFFDAAGEGFVLVYWKTRTPQSVVALFAGLPPEARDALSGFLAEEDVLALLERGEDRAFMEAIPGRMRRDESGTFVPMNNVTAVHERSTVSGSTFGDYRFYIVLAYALLRSFMGVRASRTGGPPQAAQAPL